MSFKIYLTHRRLKKSSFDQVVRLNASMRKLLGDFLLKFDKDFDRNLKLIFSMTLARSNQRYQYTLNNI